MKHLVYVIMGLALCSCIETGQSTPQYFDLSEVERLKLEQGCVLDHSGRTALRLGQYYFNTRRNQSMATYWYKESAEDGNVQGMYEYGFFLKTHNDEASKERARYWLKKAKASGDVQVAPLAESLLHEMDKEP